MIVSFFWLLWGLKFDRDRALQNLDCLAKHPIDGVRLFTEVGQDDDSWSDRQIDRAWSADMLAEALPLLRERGMRALVTVFADRTRRMASERDLIQHLDNVLDVGLLTPDAVLNIAIANEGVGFDGDLDLLRRLAQRVKDRSPFLVSVVSGLDEFDILAGRTERKITGDGGMWDHTEQPYDLRDTARVGSDEEPIGPESSNAADDDALRNTAHAVCTWINRAPIYCYHPGAGIRGGGGADRARGRYANFWEQPTLETTLQMLTAARDFLPADLASFGPVYHSHPRNEGLYPFKTGPLQPHDAANWFLKTYATRKGGRFAGVFLKVERDVPLEAPASMRLTIADLRGGVRKVELAEGERAIVTERGAIAFVGEDR